MLSLKMVALVMANSSEPDCDPSAESLASKKDQVLLLDIWAQFYPALWTDGKEFSPLDRVYFLLNLIL